ncbi:hypothetical protein [Hyphococcus sp.]|uniref:hypothetical protein n=1 Tax=Hyphococcus sp. TaxID=2038636 RepID=UPI003CCB9387
MRRLTALTACAVICGGAAAHAHPGEAILTTGNGERTVMGGGVTIEEISGVHIFRGGGAPEPDELLGAETPEQGREKEIEIVFKKRPFRNIRRLRTQGFYSGVPYPSRRYRQGFYSGQKAGF